MANLHPTQKKLVHAVRAEFMRLKADIRMDRLPREVTDEERNLIVAQNMLRTCLEATLEQMLPYSALTPVDLAIRLASYCLSALPIESQEESLAAFLKILPEAHWPRIQGGIRLATTWDTPGLGERDNFPVVS